MNSNFVRSRTPSHRPMLAMLGAGLFLRLATVAPAVALTCGYRAATDFCSTQATDGGGSAPETDDRYGQAIAFGDFDGDGKADMAVGVPGENNGAGIVEVFYTRGFTLDSTVQAFGQDQVAGDDNGAQDGDQFGWALAAGDFNGDGFDDLAVGSPGEAVPGSILDCGIDITCDDGGLVHVIPGGTGGLRLDLAYTFDYRGAIEGSDDLNFGYALAAGDVDGDGHADLYIGAPGEPGATTSDNGAVLFYPSALFNSSVYLLALQEEDARAGSVLAFGSFGGSDDRQIVAGIPLSDFSGHADAGAVGLRLRTGEQLPGITLLETSFGAASADPGDNFGAALAIGDFDGDSFEDLAIGSPGTNNGPGFPDNSGRIYLAFGSGGGLTTTRFQILGEDSLGGETAAANEFFGFALAAGDFDGDGKDDLLVGAPGEFTHGNSNAGVAFVLYGSAAGLSTSRFRQLSQEDLGGVSQIGAFFGDVLAAGDLDGDGVAEAAFGVPNQSVSGHSAAGEVYVTRRLDPEVVFLDGFEGGTVFWSTVVN